MTDHHNAITAITIQLQKYFDGLYSSDIRLLGEVFHPEAIYVCPTQDTLIKLSMPEYLPMVEKRLSPATKNEPRLDQIISISIVSATTAIAQVKCAIQPKLFVDILSFIWIDGNWKIISKVFHYQLINEIT